MSRYYGNTLYNRYSGFSNKPKKNPWIKACRIIFGILGTCVVLIIVAVCVLVSYFSSGRIIKLIEEKSSEYTNAEIKIGDLNYKLFKTYPWLELEIDSLTVISKSLSNISKEELQSLPFNSDSLASIAKLKLDLNIPDLIHNKIRLKNIELMYPSVNLVMVNDSVSNFNIVHSTSKDTKLPEIELSEVKIISPLNLEFFSLKDTIETRLDVESFFLALNDDKNYDIGMEGLADVKYKDFSFPEKTPLKIISELNFNLPSLTLLINNLSLEALGINVDLKGNIKASHKGVEIEEADLNLKIEDAFNLLNMIPSITDNIKPLPHGIAGNLPLELSFKLLKPYFVDAQSFKEFELSKLPYFMSNLKVQEGEIEYIPPQGKKVNANDIYLDLVCNYNPQISEETNIIIKDLHLFGEGVSLEGFTEINNLNGDQQNFEGRFNFQSSLMKSLSYILPQLGFNLNGHLKGLVKFSGSLEDLGKSGIKNIYLSGDIQSKSLDLNSSNQDILKLKKLNGKYKIKIPQYPLSNYSGTTIDFSLLTDSIFSISSSSSIEIKDLCVDVDLQDTISGNPDPFGTIQMSVNSLKSTTPSSSVKAEKIDLKLQGHLLQNYLSPSGNNTYPNITGNDSIIESRIKYTPMFLEYNGESPVQTFINLVDIESELKVKEGNMKFKDYLLPVNFKDLDIASDLDYVRFKASNLDIGSSGLDILGEIDGVRSFINSSGPSTLKASMDIRFTNVNINELSWGYYGTLQGKGVDSMFYLPPLKPYTASDSICVLIPRNIEADIRLNSKSAEYMQFKFSPLSADILVRDGDATLRNLTIGAPYGTIAVDWTYSTKHLDNIFMDLKGKVKDFNFINFYKVFPSLLSKAPELHNLSGQIDASFDCDFKMFPDMFMNSQSLKGNLNIKGSDLEFARKGKIERITHLMLIKGDQPIKIDNINISGSYHDNLFQLNPFKINFEDYQLGLAGVNNTDGDMYYHISLEKSPFHLPFGVSLYGKMKHPEIRLGGTHIDDYKSEKVSSDIESKIDVNIMAWLRRGWIMFLQEAAKYQLDKVEE